MSHIVVYGGLGIDNEVGGMVGERRGLLFLVVGPSGVGKDSLIEGARRRLAADAGCYFPQRLITRSEEAGGEDHRSLTKAAFERLEAEGGFMLSWQAHGHSYAIPNMAEQALSEGRSVVANVSRQVIEEARQRWSPLRVVSVSAPREVLAARLATRGRETPQDVERRLERAQSYKVTGEDVRELVNDDRLEDAIGRFLALLEAERRDALTMRVTGTGPSE